MNKINPYTAVEMNILKDLIKKKEKLISVYNKKINTLRDEIKQHRNDLESKCNHEWVIDRDCYDHKTHRYCIHCDLYN